MVREGMDDVTAGSSQKGRLRELRVLLVIRERLYSRYLHILLERSGSLVVGAPNSAQAAESALSISKPDIIFLDDRHMVSPASMVRLVREKSPRTRIIVLTDEQSRPVRHQWLEAGVDEVVDVGVSEQELVEKLHDILGSLSRSELDAEGVSRATLDRWTPPGWSEKVSLGA